MIQCFFHNESGRDDVTPAPDRIMQKTGLCSSGGKGSQGMAATAWQHTTNQPKPVDKVAQGDGTGVKIVYY